MSRRVAAPDLDVVAVEGDVDSAELGRFAGALVDEAAQALRERDAAGLDPDERNLRQVAVRLDDLVRDARESAAESFVVEEDGSLRGLHRAQGRRRAAGGRACSVIRLLSGLAGPG
jgi:hypothetical protein